MFTSTSCTLFASPCFFLSVLFIFFFCRENFPFSPCSSNATWWLMMIDLSDCELLNSIRAKHFEGFLHMFLERNCLTSTWAPNCAWHYCVHLFYFCKWLSAYQSAVATTSSTSQSFTFFFYPCWLFQMLLLLCLHHNTQHRSDTDCIITCNTRIFSLLIDQKCFLKNIPNNTEKCLLKSKILNKMTRLM